MSCQARCLLLRFLFFFFYDPAATEIYTLSLHDALPILIILNAKRAQRNRMITEGQSRADNRLVEEAAFEVVEATDQLMAGGLVVEPAVQAERVADGLQIGRAHV